MSLKKRIESEAKSVLRITNQKLVCKDCDNRFDDSKIFGNTSKCFKYQTKPNKVLLGGECDEYVREQD